jgi:hypothetical protein
MKRIPSGCLALASVAVILAACAAPRADPTGTSSSSPVPTSSGSAGPDASVASAAPSADGASPSAFPSGEQVGDPVGPPDVAVGDWVVSTVEGLRLREAAGLAGPSIGLLRIGYEGTVIDGPVAMDGYEWIHVAWPGLPSGSGCATGPDEDGFLSFCGASGWVAMADELGNAWVASSTPDCPEQPTTVKDASMIRPGVRLECFGDEELSLTGFIAPEAGGRGCYPGYDHEPAWLGPCAIAFLQGQESRFDATTYELAVNVHPELGRCDFGGTSPQGCPFAPYVGGWVAVTGVLDHPDAESCEIKPRDGNDHAPDAAAAVYACRERFVVTAVEPRDRP